MESGSRHFNSQVLREYCINEQRFRLVLEVDTGYGREGSCPTCGLWGPGIDSDLNGRREADCN